MGLISRSDFAPFFLLRGPHLQTIWAAKFRRKPVSKSIEWEQLELDDGDFLELVWMKNPNRPTVVILPGLEGNFYRSSICSVSNENTLSPKSARCASSFKRMW